MRRPLMQIVVENQKKLKMYSAFDTHVCEGCANQHQKAIDHGVEACYASSHRPNWSDLIRL